MRNIFSSSSQLHAAQPNVDFLRPARFARRIMLALVLILIWANAGFAIPLRQYREHVKKAIGALDLLHTIELHPPSYRNIVVAANVRAAREALPRKEVVEWNGTRFDVDNSWLEEQLTELEKSTDSESERAPVLDGILERLQALEARLEEIDKAVASSAPGNKEMNERLAAILRRAEYARVAREESALSRVTRQFIEWMLSLFGKRRSLNPGSANNVSLLAQIVVVAIAVAALAYVLSIIAPRLRVRRKGKKTSKPRARVVLGERLEADQSSADLLAEAEALARAGDLRGAIRRGYIALLIELADRKILSLAQHKTNRDYLHAVRGIQRLYPNMEALTNNFERHWYGVDPAEESDWVAFRAGYKEAITST